MRKDWPVKGHKVRRFGNDLGKRGTGGVSACHRKTVKAAEHFVFAVPEACDGTAAGDVGVHLIGCNLGYGDFSHGPAKRPQGPVFGVETHAHGLLVGNVLSDQRR